VLRAQLSKESKLALSISEPGILTAVVRAEQNAAEDLSRQIQEIAQSTPVRIGMRGREVKVMVAHSSLTFKGKPNDMTVTSPLVAETRVAAGMSGEATL
jgi:hypothetical protein